MEFPKFLLADNSQDNPDRIYIVHTEEPKFVIGFDIEDFNNDQEIMWFTEQPEEAEDIAELLIAAEAYLIEELDNQEDMYEE